MLLEYFSNVRILSPMKHSVKEIEERLFLLKQMFILITNETFSEINGRKIILNEAYVHSYHMQPNHGQIQAFVIKNMFAQFYVRETMRMYLK